MWFVSPSIYLSTSRSGMTGTSSSLESAEALILGSVKLYVIIKMVDQIF